MSCRRFETFFSQVTYIVSSLGSRLLTVSAFELLSAGAPPSLAGPNGSCAAPDPFMKPFSSFPVAIEEL